jgi:two-component system, OmpR family, sensor kinase
MFARLSLRARLILGVIALAAIGLVSADAVTYASLRSFLVHRVDSTLASDEHAGGGPGDGGHGLTGLPGVVQQFRSADGTRVLATYPAQPRPDQPSSSPSLPATISLPAAPAGGPDKVRYFTVPAATGAGKFRVRASLDAGATVMIVLATSLHDVNATLHQLLLIELLVTAAVLAALALLGLWVVRVGLRPLEAIGNTAARIAAGDLTQRVERADDRTEVGRLGLALNAMLHQIESAFKEREASERRLRRFVADASHELRTPLAAVRAYSELFARGASERPADLERSMKGITRESERMSLLVEDLLLLARLDEGRPLERSPVDLADIVSEAVETAHMVEPGRPIDVELDSAVVLGDRDRLRQVVDNLLANVRAHTPPGTPAHVTLSRSNGSVSVVVADSGPGMSEEQVAHVFERFYRTDGSRARASGGVGLGLSIVSAVTEAHGGSVSATSRPGEGATFRIELPLSA